MTASDIVRRTLVVGGLLLTIGATAARAEEPIVANQAYCDGWPGIDDERKARRKAGVEEGVRGDVALRCQLNGHALRYCKVTSEAPINRHFAEAALLLVPEYYCSITHIQGRPVVVDLTYVFDRVLPDHPAGRVVPNVDQLKAAFPPAAAKAGTTGSAVIECNLTIEGLLQRCKVVADAPPNWGFGLAALLLAPGFRLARPAKDGVPIPDGTVRFSILFPNIRGGGASTPYIQTVAPKVYWDVAPTRADVNAIFAQEPHAPQSLSRIVFRCGFMSDGLLGQCDLLNATTNDPRFVQATRTLLPKFRMAVGSVDPTVLKDLKANVMISYQAVANGGAPTNIANPEWIRTPGGQMPFPGKAVDAGVKTGRAQLDCVTDAHGMMTGCQVVAEDPTGLDFGAAAKDVASVMGINPWDDDGYPVEGAHVKFALRLNAGDNGDAPAAAPH